MAEGEVIYAQSEKNDLKGFLYRYLRYWYVFLLCIIICVSAAVLYLNLVTPQYLITSSLLIRDIDKGPDFESGNPAFKDLDIFNSATSIENETESLKSVTLMQRVLDQLSLQTSYYIQNSLRKKEIFGIQVPIQLEIERLSDEAYDKNILIHLKRENEFALEDEKGAITVHQYGQTIKKPYGTFTVTPKLVKSTGHPKSIFIKFHNLRDLAIAYNKELTVAQINKKANVLTVSLLDPNPEKGKAIINKLIEVYNQENKEDQNTLATNTISFINNRLGDLTSELSGIEKSVEQFKRRNEVTDVRSEASAYLEESRNYNNQLSNLAIQLDIVESLERYLSQQGEQFELVPSNLRIDDPTLLEFIVKFNDLQLQRERMLRTAEPGNPLVVNINEQLARLRLNILENLRTIKRGLLVTRGNLSSKANSFQSRITKVPNIERELNAINRQEGVKRDLYVYLLQKREESSLSLASAVSNTRIIDPALATKEPVTPKKPVVLVGAVLLGLLLPLAFILVPDLLNDHVKKKRDITKATSVPVLGEISYLARKSLLVISDKKKTRALEQFRLIRGNLFFTTMNNENQVILVTSGTKGEGKTFFSINLALSLRYAGKNVVLVDFNLREPKILARLGAVDEVGVTNYLNSANPEMNDLIRSTLLTPDLSIIGAGPLPLNPTEYMMNPKVGQFISELKERFDHIIIDSAPVGQVADAFTLSPYIDVTIFMVRYNVTPKANLELINEIAMHNKLKNPLLVLNAARKYNSPTLK